MRSGLPRPGGPHSFMGLDPRRPGLNSWGPTPKPGPSIYNWYCAKGTCAVVPLSCDPLGGPDQMVSALQSEGVTTKPRWMSTPLRPGVRHPFPLTPCLSRRSRLSLLGPIETPRKAAGLLHTPQVNKGAPRVYPGAGQKFQSQPARGTLLPQALPKQSKGSYFFKKLFTPQGGSGRQDPRTSASLYLFSESTLYLVPQEGEQVYREKKRGG